MLKPPRPVVFTDPLDGEVEGTWHGWEQHGPERTLVGVIELDDGSLTKVDAPRIQFLDRGDS